MAGSGKKWAIGCGIGCGLMLLIVGGIGTVGYLGVKKVMDEGESIGASFDDLTEAYGGPERFTPEADGTIPAERMEAFLAVRDQMDLPSQELGEILRNLDGVDELGNEISVSWMKKTKSGLELVPSILVFLGKRNRILLEQEMGIGEYLYIYSAGYFVMLEHDLSDGPSFSLNNNGQGDSGPIQVSMSDSDDRDVEEVRVEEIRDTLHDTLLTHLRNQVAAVRIGFGENPTAEQTAWLAELEAELAAMQDESLRLLWEEGLPANLAASLEPYRDRLDETYDAWVSALEVSAVHQ